MKTREITIKILDWDCTAEEALEFSKGNCRACGGTNTVALQMSDEFTNFYACCGCNLHIHTEALEVISGERIQGYNEAVVDVMNMFGVNPSKASSTDT